MKIEKVIKSRIERNYFFIKGQLDDIDVDYFIKRIEEGIKSKDNLNFQTNVYAKSTPFTFFCTDELFLKEEITPERGNFVLFSSFLDHYTTRNLGENRYCISFNFRYRTISESTT